MDRKWAALAQCALQLKPLDPRRAAELAIRAAGETRSAPRIAGVEAALRDNNLKQAKVEIDHVWTQSVAYAKIKHTYESAEARAIDDLAARLDRARSASCEEYNQLLTTERASNPARVAVEAARRVSCTTQPACNSDALSEKAIEQYRANQLAESLALFDAAYACKPAPALLQKAFVISCNLHDVPKARSYWKRLSSALRTAAASTCVRNGITDDMLNAP